jgi:glycerol-3-phosphate O-acyltransferase/dihydroxyacetone phosphate acyltransferase
MEAYQGSKRNGYQLLLRNVEEGMRSVIVTASDYNELKMIHTVRRLFQRSSTDTPTKEKQDIARRLSVGYKLLREKYGENIPEDLKDLKKKLEDYQNTLDYWGLKDYQLQASYLEISYPKMIYTILHGLFILTLASIPSLLLNMPVGAAAHMYSQKEAEKDLKASRVKLAARDVLLSKKILFSLVAVPVLWVIYALIAILFTNLKYETIFVLFISFPLFSYLGIMAVEASILDLKDIRPALLRLMPAFREQAVELPKLRLALKKEVRDIVAKYGPETGAAYMDSSAKWEDSMKSPQSAVNAAVENNTNSAGEFNEQATTNFLDNITSWETTERESESQPAESPADSKDTKKDV